MTDQIEVIWVEPSFHLNYHSLKLEILLTSHYSLPLSRPPAPAASSSRNASALLSCLSSASLSKALSLAIFRRSLFRILSFFFAEPKVCISISLSPSLSLLLVELVVPMLTRLLSR